MNVAEGGETNWDELFFRAASMEIRCLCPFEDVFQKHSWSTVRKTSQNRVMQLTTLFAGCVIVMGREL